MSNDDNWAEAQSRLRDAVNMCLDVPMDEEEIINIIEEEFDNRKDPQPHIGGGLKKKPHLAPMGGLVEPIDIPEHEADRGG